MQDIDTAHGRPALEQRLDELGATLSARPQLGPQPAYRARLLRLLVSALRRPGRG